MRCWKTFSSNQRRLAEQAAIELSKLKGHNVQLQQELAALQEQLNQQQHLRDPYANGFLSTGFLNPKP